MDAPGNAAIEFIDRDSGDEGFALVRMTPLSIGLTISLRQNGDIAVFLDVDRAKAIADALNHAVAQFEAGK